MIQKIILTLLLVPLIMLLGLILILITGFGMHLVLRRRLLGLVLVMAPLGAELFPKSAEGTGGSARPRREVDVRWRQVVPLPMTAYCGYS